MLDHAPEYWRDRFATEQAAGAFVLDPTLWHDRMRTYAEAGRAFDTGGE